MPGRRTGSTSWLITGDTGSGKTRSGITPLLHQVFQNEPTWGGLCIDDKGLYWETLSAMARHFGRSDDLILLQVQPDDADPDWSPPRVFNLTGDRSIPSSTYAKFVVDTASSLGQQGEKSFFKNQAQTRIAAALDALQEIRADVTLENAYHVLLNATVAMPQKFQTERRYINTFLKMLFYTHLLRRFDQPKSVRDHDNLLILWADEAQRFMTASEDGMSDFNCVDIIREARGTVVAAAQSTTSFLPPLGRDKAKVLSLNLRNRMIFRAADEDGALESADFLGKKRLLKKTWGLSAGKRTTHYSETEEHRVKPHELRSLPKHTCILAHAERGFRRRVLPPIEPDGRVCAWFR